MKMISELIGELQGLTSKASNDSNLPLDDFLKDMVLEDSGITHDIELYFKSQGGYTYTTMPKTYEESRYCLCCQHLSEPEWNALRDKLKAGTEHINPDKIDVNQFPSESNFVRRVKI